MRGLGEWRSGPVGEGNIRAVYESEHIQTIQTEVRGSEIIVVAGKKDRSGSN